MSRSVIDAPLFVWGASHTPDPSAPRSLAVGDMLRKGNEPDWLQPVTSINGWVVRIGPSTDGRWHETITSRSLVWLDDRPCVAHCWARVTL